MSAQTPFTIKELVAQIYDNVYSMYPTSDDDFEINIMSTKSGEKQDFFGLVMKGNGYMVRGGPASNPEDALRALLVTTCEALGTAWKAGELDGETEDQDDILVTNNLGVYKRVR